MRIGVSKKIGGVRVSAGTNISGKNTAKGCLWFFLFPFYALYYICIWPFIKLFKLLTNRNAKINDPTLLRQLQIFDESVKLFMTTNNPSTYFGRYKDAESAATAMAAMTSKSVVHGEPPKEAVDMLERDKTKATNAFLDRYAADIRQKAFSLTRGRKQKLESFMLVTSEFENEMTPESIAYRDELYQEMLNKLASVEGK